MILFVFKPLNGLAPPYLSELLHPYKPTCSPRSADQLLLRDPKTRLKLRGWSICCSSSWSVERAAPPAQTGLFIVCCWNTPVFLDFWLYVKSWFYIFTDTNFKDFIVFVKSFFFTWVYGFCCFFYFNLLMWWLFFFIYCVSQVLMWSLCSTWVCWGVVKCFTNDVGFGWIVSNFISEWLRIS